MRCIKDKCRYYRGHNFMASIGICLLGGNFDKDAEVECKIDKHKDKLEEFIIELEEYKTHIKDNQG